MNVDLIIPFDDRPTPRRLLWRYIRAHYRDVHPSLPITIGTAIPWTKGAAVDRAVRRTRAPILIIADADVLVSPEALGYSVISVLHGAAWSMPHGEVYRLSRRYTGVLLDGKAALDLSVPPSFRSVERQHRGPAGGGIVVLTRMAYEATGGIDPRFVGFGGDDISFARALDTLAGPCVRFDAPMVHLWHPRTVRRPGNRGSVENEQLAARYAEADGIVEAMEVLVGERRRAHPARS